MHFLQGALLLLAVVCLVTSLPQLSLPSLSDPEPDLQLPAGPELSLLQPDLSLPPVSELPLPQPDIPLLSVPESPLSQPELPLPPVPESPLPQPELPLSSVPESPLSQPELPLSSVPESPLSQPELPLSSVPESPLSQPELPQTPLSKQPLPKPRTANCPSRPRIPESAKVNGLPQVDAKLKEVKDVKRGILDNPVVTVLKKVFGKKLPVKVNALPLPLPQPGVDLLPINNVKDALSLPKLDVKGIAGDKVKLPSLPGVPAAANAQSGGLESKVNRLLSVLKLLGWIQEVGDKYIATSGKEETLEVSKNACKAIGGRLATPMNEVENRAIAYFTQKHNRYAYLGLKESPVPGIFQYENGLPVRYSKWRKNEPSGQGKEACVEMYTDGQWNDKSCNQERLTVCEF